MPDFVAKVFLPLIEHLRLVIAKMKREMFGPRSERTQLDVGHEIVAYTAAG